MTSLRVRWALTPRGSPSAAAPPRARACARPRRVPSSNPQPPPSSRRTPVPRAQAPTSGTPPGSRGPRASDEWPPRSRFLPPNASSPAVSSSSSTTSSSSSTTTVRLAVPTGAAGVAAPAGRRLFEPVRSTELLLRSSLARVLSASALAAASRSNRLSVSRRLISRSSALVSRMIRSRLSAASASSTRTPRTTPRFSFSSAEIPSVSSPGPRSAAPATSILRTPRSTSSLRRSRSSRRASARFCDGDRPTGAGAAAEPSSPWSP